MAKLWKSLVKPLQIVDRGEKGSIADDDLFASNVSLTKVLLVLRKIVTFLDIHRRRW